MNTTTRLVCERAELAEPARTAALPLITVLPLPKATLRGAEDLFGAVEMQQLARMAATVAAGSLDADELLQEALERALRSFHRFEAGSNLHAWVRTIMQRIAIDEWRKRKRRKAVPLTDALADATAAEVAEPPAWDGLGVGDVRTALAMLDEPMRTTFRLFALENLSYKEIAARLGIPIATVGTRIARARLRLRALLVARQDERRRGRDVLACVPMSRTRRAARVGARPIAREAA